MPYQIKPEDRIHLQEFRERPFGPHGPELLRIMATLRGMSMEGKYILICTKPFKEWKLARHHGRKKPLEIFDDQVFTDRAEAEWAVLRRRWKEHTGEDLN